MWGADKSKKADLRCLKGHFTLISNSLFYRNKNKVKIRWLVAKNEDIADTTVLLQDVKNPDSIPFENSLPYFMRKLEFELNTNITKQIQRGKVTYQVCLLAKNSKDFVRGYFSQQCKEIPRSLRSGAEKLRNSCVTMFAVLIAMKTILSLKTWILRTYTVCDIKKEK